MTGYNHGIYGVKKLLRRYRAKTLDQLIYKVKKSKTFGFASKNFYASFLAVLEVERNIKTIFPDLKVYSPLPVQRVYLTNESWSEHDLELIFFRSGVVE